VHVEAEHCRTSNNLLLNREANIKHSMNFGMTVLMVAALSPVVDLTLVRLLLDRGAALAHCMDDGWTALLIATKHNHVKLVQLLLEHGANSDHQTKDG
jgi:ankyrin repeat protein